MMTLVTLSSSVLEMVNKMIKKMIKKMGKKMIMEMIKMIKMVKVVEVGRIMMIEAMHTLLKAGGVEMEHQAFTQPVHLIITS